MKSVKSPKGQNTKSFDNINHRLSHIKAISSFKSALVLLGLICAMPILATFLTLSNPLGSSDEARSLIALTIANAVLVILLGLILATFIYEVAGKISDALKTKENLINLDPISSLHNRQSFEKEINTIRHNQCFDKMMLIIIDIDHFKEINESKGNQIGDEVLSFTGKTIHALCPDASLKARIASDQFAIIINDVENLSKAQDKCKELLDAFNAASEGISAVSHLSYSMGISLGMDFDHDKYEPNELVRRASVALNKAKKEGRGNFSIYELDMDKAVRERVRIAHELRLAIDNNELEVWYQPQMANDGKTILGSEALVRWRHPTKGLIPPFEFISVAEETGLIEALGLTVLRQACTDALNWEEQNIAINVSTPQLRNPHFPDRVAWVLAETGIEPSRVELEVTESVVMDDESEAYNSLIKLRDLGVKIALDDFGTGYSSLSYLRKFPFDKIKIDRSFITDLGMKDDTSAIVHAVIGLADTLGMETVAEGIETPAQEKFLQISGCNRLQGYYYSKPIPKEEYEIFTEKFSQKHQENKGINENKTHNISA